MIDKFSHGFINSVYEFNDFTLNELICKLAQKMDEVISQSNEAFNYLDWLKGEGSLNEVLNILLAWKEDGTLETLINDVLLENIQNDLDAITKETKRNKNIKDYRFLCATFKNGDEHQKLIIQGSDDGEKFYEIAPEGCYIPKLASSLRDPSIVKVGDYFYITYTTVA